MQKPGRLQRGMTLVEVLIGVAIFSMVSSAVYVGYASVIDISSASRFTSFSLSILESRVEMVRNMRYEDVGTVGGVPAGTLPQAEIITADGVDYSLTITVRNVDDPFDGTVFGNPFDPSPADYKLVQFDMTCATGCTEQRTVSVTTFVAQKQLENEDRNGSLLITVIDANGEPVPQATVHVENPNSNPIIDLTTTTDNEGQLLLLSVATGSAVYEITASKTGFSTDRTYPPDNPANALKPHTTVASQQLTQITMAIDRVSSITIQARDNFCAPTPPFAFQLIGSKLIGELPDVAKYDSAHATGAGGDLTLSQLEWDTYRVVPTDATFDIVGATGLSVVTLAPNTAQSLAWTIASRSYPSALVSVTDTAGVAVNNALVSVSDVTYNRSVYSGQWSVADSDWSDGQYADSSAGLETSAEGTLTLALQGTEYATGSAETLTSQTFDLGTSDVVLQRIAWSPSSQSDGTTLRFQIAANNDNSTWNFMGPNGASTSYFDSPGAIDVSSLNGNRYVRYRAFLETTDPDATPTLDDVDLFFSSACVSDGSAYFGGLSIGATYTIIVEASGFQTASASYTASDAWAHLNIIVSP